MESFEAVEADFQQYYNLDLEISLRERGFRRYARLLLQLPETSRFVKKYAPAASWTWSDEIASRTLYELSMLKTMTYNMNREKGAKPVEYEEQVLPDYVMKARDEQQKAEEARAKEEAEKLRAFWEARNPRVSRIA